jgi:lysine 2,3-aminomutase
VPGLVHRYPDRVVLLAAPDCPVRCRHCNRRRRHAGEFLGRSPEALAAVEAYLRATPAVREVILSGGDPLTLDDDVLAELLGRLLRIDSVETLRVHTRAPVTCPMRVTDDLVRLLRGVAPLHLVTQFNHPRELTPEALAACGRLVDAGVPVASQGVLLRGVNADPEVLVDLLRGLHRARIRPLYLFQLDPVVGTERFRTRVRDSMALVGGLRGRISGLAIPQLVLDAPGGHGKVALLPEAIVSEGPGFVRVRTYTGAEVDYPDTGAPS